MTNIKIKRVLIVEDEQAYSRALDLKLKKAGFDVETALNGEDAISVLKKENFDLLVTDLIMPKMNGFELLGELKNNNIKIPAIVLSNLNQEEDKNKANSLDVKFFLEKSNTTISELINIITDMLK